jgi:hypothetical protein
MQLLREREMLELLLFKLDEQQMLLATGRNRWIRHSVNEIERVLSAMPTVALSRDTLVVAVADEWGVPDATTLGELIDAAPTEAWREVLTGHLSTMRALATEIDEMKQVNEQRLRSAIRVTQETIAGLGAPTGEYTPAGDVVRDGDARLLDTRV